MADDLFPADRPLSPALEARWRRLRAQIEAHAHLLESHGGLVDRGDRHAPVWRIRFCSPLPGRGFVRQTLYVGTHYELVRRARLLLQQLRDRAAWDRESLALAG